MRGQDDPGPRIDRHRRVVLLREELILVTPVAPVCRPDCAGLCPVCGDDLNDRPHAHDVVVDRRWTALQELRDKIGKTES